MIAAELKKPESNVEPLKHLKRYHLEKVEKFKLEQKEISINDVVKMRAFLAKKPKTGTDIAPDLSLDAAVKGAK